MNDVRALLGEFDTLHEAFGCRSVGQVLGSLPRESLAVLASLSASAAAFGALLAVANWFLRKSGVARPAAQCDVSRLCECIDLVRLMRFGLVEIAGLEQMCLTRQDGVFVRPTSFCLSLARSTDNPPTIH